MYQRENSQEVFGVSSRTLGLTLTESSRSLGKKRLNPTSFLQRRRRWGGGGYITAIRLRNVNCFNLISSDASFLVLLNYHHLGRVRAGETHRQRQRSVTNCWRQSTTHLFLRDWGAQKQREYRDGDGERHRVEYKEGKHRDKERCAGLKQEESQWLRRRRGGKSLTRVGGRLIFCLVVM